MINLLKLCVVGAVVGSATYAEAGERSLFSFLRGDSDIQTVQAELPLLPQPASPYDVGPGTVVQPVPHHHAHPVPAPAYAPHYGHGYGHPVHAAPMPRIRVKDRHNIHPCAVEKVVMVPNPCSTSCDTCCNACDMVPVTICVPPCECEEHRCRKGGRCQKFDYGKYEVEIRVKDLCIEVDYDD